MATGDFSTALGQNTTAAFANSTAIGRDAATTRDDQMMFGTATNTYTTRGITSAASRAAQTGPVEVVTSDAGGNLATSTAAGLGLATMDQVDRNTEGVAMGLAMSRIPTVLPEDMGYAVSAGLGMFSGETALSFGGSMALTDNIFLNGGGAFGLGNSNNGSSGGASAGITFGW